MKIGFLGTGLMGLPMTDRLLQADLNVVVYNRTAEKLDRLRQAGATVANTAAEVVRSAEVVVLMLSDASAIQSVLLAEDVQPHLTGKTVIQMGTIAPTQSREIAQAVSQAGGDYLEAPVLGSIPEAEAGKLQVMVGATLEQFQRWESLLQHFGIPRHIGEVGAAAALKLGLNQLIASLTTAFATSLRFVQQQGVEVETFMEILRHSALHAPTFDKKLQRMIDDHYDDPNFPTKHLLKDVNLFLDEADRLHLRTDSLAGVRQTIEAACAMGLTDADYSALAAAIDSPPES